MGQLLRCSLGMEVAPGRPLREAIAQVALRDLLEPPERTFYEELPDLVPIWRGCERGRERGLSWTTQRDVAEGFAQGKRCVNANPTLVSAVIAKPHIFGVFLSRDESEIAVDPRRLRRIESRASSSGSLAVLIKRARAGET
jgi:hypothetical protein